jgi:hypothetical protein
MVLTLGSGGGNGGAMNSWQEEEVEIAFHFFIQWGSIQ